MNKKDVYEKIEELENQLSKLREELYKPESKVFKPKHGDKYYLIDNDGIVCCEYWLDTLLDNMRYTLGNCFETKEEAEFEVERLKVIAELKRFSKEHNEPLNWNSNTQHKYYIYFDGRNNLVYFSATYRCKKNDIYFSSIELLEQAIEEIGEDRIKKYYLGVENE